MPRARTIRSWTASSHRTSTTGGSSPRALPDSTSSFYLGLANVRKIAHGDFGFARSEKNEGQLIAAPVRSSKRIETIDWIVTRTHVEDRRRPRAAREAACASSRRGVERSLGDREFGVVLESMRAGVPAARRVAAAGGAGVGQRPLRSSVNGLKTLVPGRRKWRSLPVTIVSPWRRAVAAI